MRVKRKLRNTYRGTAQKSAWHPRHGVGRNNLKKLKTLKLVNIKGAVWPSLTRLARLSTSKILYDLVNRMAFNLIQNTSRLLRVQSSSFLEEASSSDRLYVEDLIHRYLSKVKITCVRKVNNPFLKALYDLTKREYQVKYGYALEEKELFHSTKQSVIEPIVNDNFNWRLVCRARFGKGTCFSSDADYANCHANRRNGSSRAFIICRVLVGRKMLGSSCLNIPNEGYDTAVGPRTKELIYVKFRDTECLPLYVAYYDDKYCKYYESKYNDLPRDWFN